MSSVLTKWRAWLLLLALAFVGSAYLVVRNHHVGELRAAARITARWDSRDRAREPAKGELARLPERARFMIDSQCNKEGGNPFARRNCYAEAADWMLDEAKEQEPRRDLGYAGLALTVLLGAASWYSRRTARKRELALR